MEERRTIRSCGTVTEEYRRTFPNEVVERYERPLPAAEKAESAAVSDVQPKKKKRVWLWVTLIVLGAIGLAAAAFFALRAVLFALWDYYYYDGWDGDYYEENFNLPIDIPTYPVGRGAKLQMTEEDGETLTAQEIYRKANPSVVTVTVRGRDGYYLGTGVIFRADGYILTNQHLLAGGEKCTVLLEDESNYPARFVAADADQDLAILKIEAKGLTAAEFGDSDELAVGDAVYAIGNPMSINLRGTMTDGIVSAVKRNIEVDGRTMTLIQTNAALNSGNSGGPLIDCRGRVVGINVIKMYSEYFDVEGLGFAIPTASIERTVNDLLACGKLRPEPLLGLTVATEAEKIDETHSGLYVFEVLRGGAAERAGVRAGDFVLAADGVEMKTTDTLLKVRRRHQVGDTLDLTLWREGEIVTVTLELKESIEDYEK